MLKLTFPFAIRASWRNFDEVMAARGPWRRVEYDAVSEFSRLTATGATKITVGSVRRLLFARWLKDNPARRISVGRRVTIAIMNTKVRFPRIGADGSTTRRYLLPSPSPLTSTLPLYLVASSGGRFLEARS